MLPWAWGLLNGLGVLNSKMQDSSADLSVGLGAWSSNLHWNLCVWAALLLILTKVSMIWARSADFGECLVNLSLLDGQAKGMLLECCWAAFGLLGVGSELNAPRFQCCLGRGV